MKCDVVEPEPRVFEIPLNELKPGQVGVVLNGAYCGSVVMGAYSSIVSLSKPQSDWLRENFHKPAETLIRLFPPGTKINLTVE